MFLNFLNFHQLDDETQELGLFIRFNIRLKGYTRFSVFHFDKISQIILKTGQEKYPEQNETSILIILG